MSAAEIPFRPAREKFVPSPAQRRFHAQRGMGCPGSSARASKAGGAFLATGPAPRNEQVHAEYGHASITDCLLDTGVPRSTYYRWAKDPGFRDWFTKAFYGRQLLEGWHLINIARRKAGDDFRYWKALRDLTLDPKGIALLQGWSDACASISLNDAHDTVPDGDFEPGPTPNVVPLLHEPNQQLGSENGTASDASIGVPKAPDAAPIPPKTEDPAEANGQNSAVPRPTEKHQSVTPENGTDSSAPPDALRSPATGQAVPKIEELAAAAQQNGAVPPLTQSNQSVECQNGTES